MPSKRAVTEPLVNKLKSMCCLYTASCRMALEGSDGDIEKALARLIDAAQVKYEDLDPDAVSDELFGRAYQRHLDALFTEMPEPSGSFTSSNKP